MFLFSVIRFLSYINFELLFSSTFNFFVNRIDFVLGQSFLHVPIDQTIAVTRQFLFRMHKRIDQRHLYRIFFIIILIKQ